MTRRTKFSLLTLALIIWIQVLLLLHCCHVCQALRPPPGLSWGRHSVRPSSSSSSKHLSSTDGKDLPSSSSSSKNHGNKLLRQIKSVRDFIFNEIVTGNASKPSSRLIQHILYWITAADAIHSVFLNEYSGLLFYVNIPVEKAHQALVPSVYSKLFYFARLRPRLLYVIGSLVRALQLCTPFRRILDPTAGVGAGINLCAMLAGSRWLKPFVLGWATTKWLWTWLGARQVDRAYLPITLSIHEWEDKRGIKKKKPKDSGQDG